MKQDDEFKKRLTAAKTQRKMLMEGVGREVYKFCFNGREVEWDRTTRVEYEPAEIFTDFPSTLAEDFSGELFSTMMPENATWVEYEAGTAIPADQVEEVTQQIAAYESAIDRSIKASNFYNEGYTAFQDATVGNVAMWIERPRINGPVVCEAVSLPQLYLRLGPEGIADRFRERMYFTSDLPNLFPRAQWSKAMERKIKDAKHGKSTVCWGFWPKYDDPENPVWCRQIRVDGDNIGLDMDLSEAGEMELVVGRFNAVPDTPWGRGPGYRMLPTIRVLNAVSEMTLEGMDRNLDPAFTYPHDGVLDLSDGIEQGLGYPAMPGSADSIRPIGTVDNLDYGFYSQEQLELSLRDGFYRQIEQRGKTPPSASQYIGDEQKSLRRIARPAAKTWDEFGVGVLRRFEFLERQGGRLRGINAPLIEEGVIAVRPISPLERAQAREDVLIADSIIERTVNSVGPEQAMLVVDMQGTMRNIKDKLKDKLVQFRTPEEMQKIMQQMQRAQGAPGGGPEQ